MNRRATVAFLLCITLFVLATICASKIHIDPSYELLRQLRENPRLDAPLGAEDIPAQWFSNFVDHFDVSNMQTYQQRYYVNDQFFLSDDKRSPVFLYLGCEGELTNKWVQVGLAAEWGRWFGAKLVALEHRYYGQSQPVASWDSDNMKYLTTYQALEDIAHFIDSFKDLRDHPWVVFGGSYGGSLSAWARLKYPNLIHASVSASGPFNPQIDFPEYLSVAENSFRYYGGEQCVNDIQTANNALSVLVNSTDQKTLDDISQRLQLCHNLTPNRNILDNWSFWESLADGFASVVQYNKELGGTFNVQQLCQRMAKASDKLNELLSINNMLLANNNEKCRTWSQQDQINSITNITVDPAMNMRQWTWQTCTMYGFYQTNEGQVRSFGDRFELDLFIEQCRAAFGKEYDLARLELLADRFNSTMSATAYRGSNVIFTNGNIDPWHALSIERQSPDYGIYSHYIEGTSHCQPLYPSSAENDNNALKAARNAMFDQITTILKTFPNTIG